MCLLVSLPWLHAKKSEVVMLRMSSPFLILGIGNRGNRIEDVPSPKEKAGMRDSFARLAWKGYWQLSMLGPSAAKPL